MVDGASSGFCTFYPDDQSFDSCSQLCIVQEEFYRLESRLQTAYMMLLTAMGVQDQVRRYASKAE